MTELYDGLITDLLNNGMRYNPETIAVAYAIREEKRRIMALAARTRLMSAVDTLDEKILDILAVELRTPAYQDSFPLDVKRKLIAGTLSFYSKLGTPSAVEWIIQAIFGDGRIEEWWEYGGDPYHFRIQVFRNHAVFSVDDFEKLIHTISPVKRLSTWLDKIITTVNLPPATLHIGGTAGTFVKFGVPSEAGEYSLKTALFIGGNIGIRSSVSIPEEMSQPSFTTILRTGGVCTIISNLSKGE